MIALRYVPWITWPAGYRDFVTIQLFAGSVLFIGAIFKDEFARLLRLFGAIALTVGCFATLVDSPFSTYPWYDAAYLTMLAALSFTLAIGLKNWGYLLSGLFSSSIVLLDLVGRVLRRWPDIESFLIATVLFFVALAISIVKAGRNVPRDP